MLFNNLFRFFGLKPEGLKSNNFSDKEHKTRVLKTYIATVEKLERLISKSELIYSGRVHLLGLTELRQELGKTWPDLQERILDSLNKIISARIGAKDVFFSRSDEEHIIVFSNASDNKARLICARILQDLSEMYLGSADTSKIIVKTAIGRIKDKILFKSMSLDEIFNEISYEEVSSGDLVKVCSDNHKYNGQKRHFGEKEIPYEVVFRPVWDARNEIISTYIVNSLSIDRYKNVILGYNNLINPTSAEAMIEMDYIVMLKTINIMDELFLNNFRAIFSIPVCYETLFNSDMLKDFLSRCQLIPQALYKYISFTLTGFPIGIPETKLCFIVSSLKCYSRAIVMVCNEMPQNISYYKDCGVKGICLALPEKITNSPEYWEQLAKLVRQCKKQHIYMSLENINRVEDFILTREVGVGFLSGDVIGPYSDIPGHMSRVSWKELIVK